MYLIMCRICLFIVRTKRTSQYMRRIGQKTGTSKMGKKVMKKAMTKAFVAAYLRVSNVKKVLTVFRGANATPTEPVQEVI